MGFMTTMLSCAALDTAPAWAGVSHSGCFLGPKQMPGWSLTIRKRSSQERTTAQALPSRSCRPRDRCINREGQQSQ